MTYSEIVCRIYTKQQQSVTLTFSSSQIRPDYWVLAKKKKNSRRRIKTSKTLLNSLKDLAMRMP